jgi:hypothetical protein
MNNYWIIVKKSSKFNQARLYLSKKQISKLILWTARINERETYKTYQKAYAVANKIKDLGIKCEVKKVTEQE